MTSNFDNIPIERAKPEHLAEITAVDVAAYGPESASHWLEEGLSDPEGYYFAAFINDVIVGYCGMYRLTYKEPNYCKIATVAVLPDFQGKGIGRAMMHKILDTARELGLDRTKLEVRTKNTAAVALYKSLRFVVEEHIEGYYTMDSSGDDGYIMWRYEQS